MLSRYEPYQRTQNVQTDQNGRFERYVYQDSESAQNSPFKTICLYSFGALLVGLVLITLNSIHKSFDAYEEKINWLFYSSLTKINWLFCSAITVSVLFFLAFLAGFLYLIFEEKANKKVSQLKNNKIEIVEDESEEEEPEQIEFNNSNSGELFLMPRGIKEGTPEFNELVLDRYYDLKDRKLYSKTKLAMDVFRKKGSFYENKLAVILAAYDEEL